jgi:hypothetical protein
MTPPPRSSADWDAHIRLAGRGLLLLSLVLMAAVFVYMIAREEEITVTVIAFSLVWVGWVVYSLRYSELFRRR